MSIVLTDAFSKWVEIVPAKHLENLGIQLKSLFLSPSEYRIIRKNK